MNTTEIIESYSRLKNLKLVGSELGIPWQSVYVQLRKAGVVVTGDKSRYGSATDRLAVKAESEFQRLVPFATNNNQVKYQAKVDFSVGGVGVDIKGATLKQGCKKFAARRWAFCVRKQEQVAEFIVCFAFLDSGEYRVFLIPGEMVHYYQTISIGENGKSKWLDYEVKPSEVFQFFSEISKQDAVKEAA